jgi:sporulation protein YlmC with PRC-barrel domain
LEVLAMAIDIQPRLSTQEEGAHILAAENVKGYDVREVDNNRIGKVDDLIVDESTGRVRFLKVGDGGILGIGRTHRLVPVDVVKGVSGDFVFLDVSRMQFENAPTWRPLADPTYVNDVLQYYGTQPFWKSGYQQPDWTTPD